MTDIIDDVEQQLSASECHFNWRLEANKWIVEPENVLVWNIMKYNTCNPRLLYRRLRECLKVFYVMYRSDMVGWERCLENSIRILNLATDPDGPPAAIKLPDADDELFKASSEEFFSECCKDDNDECSSDEGDFSDPEDGDFSDQEDGNGFLDRLDGATHIVRAVEAHILFDSGAPVDEIRRKLSAVVPVEKMDVRQQGFILAIKTNAMYRLGAYDSSLLSVIELLRVGLERDPGDWLVAQMYIKFIGYLRRRDRPYKTVQSDLEEVVRIVDGFRDAEVPGEFQTALKFSHLEVLTEYVRTFRARGRAPQDLVDLRNSLCEEVVNKVAGYRLAFVAQVLSNYPKNLDRACRLVKRAFSVSSTSYVAAKAANIFQKANQLELALKYAQGAAIEAIGSFWQVLELKVALKQPINGEKFFGLAMVMHPLQSRTVHLHAFVYYLLITDDFSTGFGHFLEILENCDANQLPPGLEDFFCMWSKRQINTVELAYRTASYFMGNDQYQPRSAPGTRRKLSDDGPCRIIVTVIGALPEVTSRFQAPRGGDLDGIIYGLTGYRRNPRPQPRAQSRMSQYYENRYPKDNTNWREK